MNNYIISILTVFLLGQPLLAFSEEFKGINNVWGLEDAWQASSLTRASICLNGIWRFHPLNDNEEATSPAGEYEWGWIKVPGIWPDSRSLKAKANSSAQHIVPNAILSHMSDSSGQDGLKRAWYKRELTVPSNWQGRRIRIEFTMLSTHGRIFLDGHEVGTIRWPGGEVDITEFVKFGKKQILTILVSAKPSEKVSKDYNAPGRITKQKNKVKLRGITGDMYLNGEPINDAISDLHLICSTRKSTLTFNVGVRNSTRKKYAISAKILRNGKVVKTFSSSELDQVEVKNDRVSFVGSWSDAEEWDTDTPDNLYDAVVTLHDEGGRVLDKSLPIRFGFREFWVEGQDFYLNGRRIHLRGINIKNANEQADISCKNSALQTCRKLIEYGFNFAVTNNHNFLPGVVGYIDGLLQACDETGMLISFTLPHVKDFGTKLENPDEAKRYRELTEWIIRRVQNHPSIIAYSMNHNATGYHGDQNPLKMDGIYDFDNPKLADNIPKASRKRMREQAKIAEDIARSIDSTRVIYHHQSGNLGDMYTVNTYLNWAPMQERSDWLEHWSTKGLKPMFFCEWGLPHIASFSSYRGPRFIWRAKAFQHIWDSEYAAAYFGESAYEMNPTKIKSMRHEEELYASGKPFNYGKLNKYIQGMEQNVIQSMALFASDNWRSHRAWNISAMIPWDRPRFWARVKKTKIIDNPEKFMGVKQPGIVPDVFRPGATFPYEPDSSSYKPTSLGRTWLRWNMPLCAFIGGGQENFTDKTHNFLPGETVKKQLVIINDKRRKTTCSYSWNIVPGEATGKGQVEIEAGGKKLVPVNISLSSQLQPGEYKINAVFDFGKEQQEDTFTIHVLSPPKSLNIQSRIALFDPKGMTAKKLDAMQVRYDAIKANADLSSYEILIIGREALSDNRHFPSLEGVKDGLKVLVFEQNADTLQNRLGFRINVHGMRKVFARSTHPALNELGEGNLSNWRGSSTLIEPYLKNLPYIETDYPKWSWCGFENSRVWRCKNRGNVASVLIEKPPVGNWLPIIDCGFDLQYSPLLENIQGKGRIIFCQLDVTERDSQDPAADRIVSNLLSYLDKVEEAPPPPRVLYAGGADGASLLSALGIQNQPFNGRMNPASDVLVLASGAENLDSVKNAMEQGADVLCIGLDRRELSILFGNKIKVKEGSFVSALVKDLSQPEYRGISNSDLHWRTRPQMAAIVDVDDTSNLALKVIQTDQGKLVFLQVRPWEFNYDEKPYLRTTYRRTVFLVSRLLANLGVYGANPLLEKFRDTSGFFAADSWKDSYYVQKPEAVDDPYRYYRW